MIQEKIKVLEEEILIEEWKKCKKFSNLEDEHPTKRFLNLENQKQGYNEISRLTKPNPKYDPNKPKNDDNQENITITDQKDIHDHTSKFFQTIYNKDNEIKSSKEDIKEFLDMDDDTAPWKALEERKLSRELADSMEGDLTLDELTEALFIHMNPSSSPGIDGFTVAYLRVFWNSMKYVVRDTLNNIQTEELSQTLRPTIIKLLRKGDKNPHEIGNYHPISLLSIFYKLASCCITRRIKPA